MITVHREKQKDVRRLAQTLTINTSTRKRKASEDIARAIAAHIARERLPEGTQLPNEARLQETFEVGRTTLREALRLLETQGTIRIKAGPGGGPVVRTPKAEDLTSSLSLLLQMHGATFATVFAAREVIAPAIAGLAAENISKQQLAELQANVAELQQRIPMSRDEFIRNNYEFHRILAEACGNVLLAIFDATMLSMVAASPIAVSYTPRRQREGAGLHEAILQAVMARDSAAAEKALREHDQQTYDWFRRKYRDVLEQPIEWT